MFEKHLHNIDRKEFKQDVIKVAKFFIKSNILTYK